MQIGAAIAACGGFPAGDGGGARAAGRVAGHRHASANRHHSGRHGIAPDVAPAGVVALFGVAELPPTWLSPPSGVNYAVGFRKGTGACRIGVVHLGQGLGDGRVLGE